MEAEAKGEIRNVAVIQKASNDSWQASAWLLERKHKERWGANMNLEIKEVPQIIDDIGGGCDGGD